MGYHDDVRGQIFVHENEDLLMGKSIFFLCYPEGFVIGGIRVYHFIV